MSGEQLERRYRGLLRVLPKPYREARGEELLSALMDGAREGRTRPELREVLSLARLGVRVRMRGGGVAGGVHVDTRAGAMARIVAFTGTTLLALVGGIQLAEIASNLRWAPYARWSWSQPFAPALPGVDELSRASYEVPAGWLFVLVLLAVGWWFAARVLAVALFVASALLTHGALSLLAEQTVLAGVVTAALFAVRGGHARPPLKPGAVAVAAVLGVIGWAYKGSGGMPEKAVLVMQGWGETDSHHALVAVAIAVTVVGVVAFRSVVWPVALAVVTGVSVGPVLVQAVVDPNLRGSDQAPLIFLVSAVVVVAGLAVVRDRWTARGGKPAPAS